MSTVVHIPANVPATLPATPRPAALRPKQEAFAQLYAAGGNASRAYREAFECSPTTSAATIKQRAYELVHEPAVAERIRELYDAAAEGTLVSVRARMVHLQAIVEADPTEITRVVTHGCADCWADDTTIAMAMDRAIATGTTLDLDAPQADCRACRGHGAQRVVVTPTDQLSLSARRLLKSVRQKASGELEVRLHDKLQAADMLNKMQGVYVDRSVSISATMALPSLAKMSQVEALDFLETLRPTRPPITVDASIVDAEQQDATP